MTLIGAQHAARDVSFRQLQSDVALIGGKTIRRVVDAEGAAALEHAARQGRGQHAGRAVDRFDRFFERDVSLRIERALEQILRLARECASGIVKREIRVAIEARRRRRQTQLHVRLQPGRDRAAQPLGEELAADLCRLIAQRAFAAIGRRCEQRASGALFEVECDLQAIGRHGFDLERLRERRTAERRLRGPVPGRRILRRRQLERIEAVDGRRVHDRLRQLRLRIEELHRDGMPRRRRLLLILQYERQIDVVARPPDAAFAVDVSPSGQRSLARRRRRSGSPAMRRLVEP